MSLDNALRDLQSKIGQEIHVSDWVEVTQEVINEFAQATNDDQWIHVDEERAATESPFRKTIAHGFFTLSLYPYLRGLADAETPLFPGAKNVINYGLNKLRFPNAVTVGSKIRARCSVVSAENVKNSLELVETYTIEIDGQKKPACVAECIVRIYF